MTPRTNLNDGFLDSEWAWYAIKRTGVNFPNCFTYATARLSEILGREQPLDESNRVVGAQELIEKHSIGFFFSWDPIPGALMIWAYGEYGHVAVCEEVFDIATVAWSQSNYGGPMFEYEKGNPHVAYPGMTFRGYLVHEDLLNLKQKKGDEAMRCTFTIVDKNKDYYFDGKEAREITHPDEKHILNEVYKACYGNDMPHFNWYSKAPWYKRLLDASSREPSHL